MLSLSNNKGVLDNSIKAKGLYVGYDGNPVLMNVNFELRSPFFAVIMGPNGAGKSTLMRAIIGLLKPSRGKLLVYGRDPCKEGHAVRSIVSYAPQMVSIRSEVPIKVEEIVAMGILSKLPPPRIATGRVKDLVNEALKMVGLEGINDVFFNQLSGGQQRRVMIARALIRKPKALVLDEPGSMLDFKARCEIMRLLERIHTKHGTDILISSHEIPACLDIEPVIMLINRKLYAIGKTNDVLKPEIFRQVYPGLTELEGMLILGEDHVAH